LRACGLHRVCTRLKKNQSSRAVLACLWFAQGSKKIKTAEPFYDVQGDSMCSILSIDATYFFMLLNLIKGNPSVVGHFPAVDIKVHDAGETV